MAKQDPGRLIEQTEKLIRESENLCNRSRKSVIKSKLLEQVLVVSVSASRRARRRSQLRKRRKRLLAN